MTFGTELDWKNCQTGENSFPVLYESTYQGPQNMSLTHICHFRQ